MRLHRDRALRAAVSLADEGCNRPARHAATPSITHHVTHAIGIRMWEFTQEQLWEAIEMPQDVLDVVLRASGRPGHRSTRGPYPPSLPRLESECAAWTARAKSCQATRSNVR